MHLESNSIINPIKLFKIFLFELVIYHNCNLPQIFIIIIINNQELFERILNLFWLDQHFKSANKYGLDWVRFGLGLRQKYKTFSAGSGSFQWVGGVIYLLKFVGTLFRYLINLAFDKTKKEFR